MKKNYINKHCHGSLPSSLLPTTQGDVAKLPLLFGVFRVCYPAPWSVTAASLFRKVGAVIICVRNRTMWFRFLRLRTKQYKFNTNLASVNMNKMTLVTRTTFTDMGLGHGHIEA